ncbi:F510_1955 family glycosylhydrolase [Piscinibacter koreensis]|uniref:Glycosyl hydrolase n=1 Tax=Piscinibacter koreensis TaxID=2742824 RepID=A0A7Y6TYT0_9BURK|nr:glycosyl hydrolase [Schlegelella koreensis]NUZ08435.1 glycosyl hydrolase [Schlegelella koreensis]
MKRTWTSHATALALALGPLAWPGAGASEPVTLTHVHGLSYSADGSRLMVPSHHGLAVYAAGQWSKAPGPAHDFMGFSGTRTALYSSGHPAAGSGLKNPFGLIKSKDGGKSWLQLGLEGESDFHTMATSYGTNAVYVVNPHPNSRMSAQGIYFTLDDGRTWQRAQGRGLAGQLHGLAVHPSDPATVAAATDQGLFVSKDSGTTYRAVVSGKRVLSAAFALDGKDLWWSGFDGRPTLSVLALQQPDASSRLANLPALGEDAVSYFAQNPARPNDMAIATFRKSVFISQDGGRNWVLIADEGTTAGNPAVAQERR